MNQWFTEKSPFLLLLLAIVLAVGWYFEGRQVQFLEKSLAESSLVQAELIDSNKKLGESITKLTIASNAKDRVLGYYFNLVGSMSPQYTAMVVEYAHEINRQRAANNAENIVWGALNACHESLNARGG